MTAEKRCPHWILRSTTVCTACDRRERFLDQAAKGAAMPPIVPTQAPPAQIQRPYLDFQPRKPLPRPPKRKPGTTEAPFIPGLAVQPALIVVVVADRYAIDVDSILGPMRYQNICEARIACYWLLRELCKLSFPVIGMALGRDHATVMSGLRKCLRLRQESAAYLELTDTLKRDIEARAEVAA